MHRPGYPQDRGLYFVILSWIFSVAGALTVAVRVYSRAFLTRSIGSDDFAIIFAVVRGRPLTT